MVLYLILLLCYHDNPLLKLITKSVSLPCITIEEVMTNIIPRITTTRSTPLPTLTTYADNQPGVNILTFGNKSHTNYDISYRDLTTQFDFLDNDQNRLLVPVEANSLLSIRIR